MESNQIYTVEALNKFYGSEYLGVHFDEVTKDSIKARLTVDKRHLRPGGIVNGGIYLMLIETLGSISSCLHIDLSRQNPLGIQVNANHLGVAKEGDTLIAFSKAVHIGRTTQIWEVTVENQKGKTLSSGRITLLITDIKNH